MSSLTILDVGHGNCAVLQSNSSVVIIDGGHGRTLREYLREQSITQVNTVLISHADSDHLGGMFDIIAAPEIEIRRIYLNRDPLKRSKTWQSAKVALYERSRRGTQILIALTDQCSRDLNWGEVSFEVLSPPFLTALDGIGDADFDGGTLTSNSMSAVIKINTPNASDVLLAADMTNRTLNRLLAANINMQAKVLIFPHHGGLPGEENATNFANRLCQAVQPTLVVFSMSRVQHRNPRQETIAGLKQALPTAHIACTQLSKHCAAQTPSASPAHLHPATAEGRDEKRCCAGTIEIQLGASYLSCLPMLREHSAFVDAHAPTAMCRRNLSELTNSDNE